MRKLRLICAAIAALAVLAVPAAAQAKKHHAPRDRNHDQLPDKWEKRHHLSLKVKQTNKDQDHDGLTNLGEFKSGTDPRAADTDGDGVSDAAEDPDNDGVDNANEIEEHTKPRDADSDNDGVKDGNEDADHDGLSNRDEQELGDDPADADSDHDGVKDGHEDGGTVASYDSTTGSLVIDLATGSSVSGTVDSSTEFECKQAERDGESNALRAASGGDDAGEVSGGDTTTSSGDDDTGSADDSSTCTAADLTAGTLVHEAKLENGVFKKVELIK